MADPDDPIFEELFRREVVEFLAKRNDRLGTLASEMISSAEGEEAIFLRGVRTYLQNHDRDNRRMAIAFLANAFEIDRTKFKRYLRFKGLVNRMD